MKRLSAILLAAYATLTFSGPAWAQLRMVETDTLYVHRPTGMKFPVAAGQFTRTNIIEYSADGTDVSGHYRYGTPPRSVDVTIYIYPSPQADPASADPDRQCDANFEGILGTIRVHPGARLIEQGQIKPPFPQSPMPGRKAIFALDSLGGRMGPLRSETDLFCHVGRKWSIEYRTTAPADIAYEALLGQLMRDMRWPVFPEEMAATGFRSPATPGSAPNP